MRPIDILVWRCEWFEGYLLPIVKYLKHNTFRLYTLKNTIFYALLILLFPVWYEFNQILDFSEIPKTRDSHKIRDHKNFMKFGKFLVLSKFKKFQIFRGPPKFPFLSKSGVTLFWNSREFWPTQLVKIQEYTCFPKFMRLNSDFSPKNVDHNFGFSSKSGHHLFWNSRELWSPQCVKMQEYTCFPKLSRRNSNFSPKNVDRNF